MRLVHIERMDAERIREAVRERELPHGVEIARLDGRDDDLADARRLGARDHRVAVGIKLGRVQVAVGVDPHA